ncbi:hypothetical protein GCM10011521_16890 [Arenimonas soli]|uniref:HTH araC/xylS-type domain-containing protein n=1 Tax=Arenimonas soli TaxID=2269504 RepID=A0ABQ1HID7_9GAMM|nr:AraC family transcriptional regulator [Arenimonas soli]GGA79268.1 hypothetical protein GCM10011521_16890 [Arenimonas soli]
MPLEIVLRAAGAAVLLMTACVLLASAPRAALARAFLPLALGVAGFLGVNTAFDAAELPEPLWSISSFCSRMAAPALWLFCLVLFDGGVRSRGAAAAVIGTWLLLVVVDKQYFGPRPGGIPLSPVLVGLGTALVLHAGWRVLVELRGDLVERRRRARPLFALVLLAFLALDFAVDALQGYGWRPASFLLLQNGLVLVMGSGLAIWLLRAEPSLATAIRSTPPAHEPAADPGKDPELALLARIQGTMRESRLYLDPALTIRAFALRVGLPEPTVRRVINHRLGHGHFSGFVNGYRVEEAKRRLRDPATAGDKILAVALDSGFASLASFNRVFRELAGCTPSAFRAGDGRPHGG